MWTLPVGDGAKRTRMFSDMAHIIPHSDAATRIGAPETRNAAPETRTAAPENRKGPIGRRW